MSKAFKLEPAITFEVKMMCNAVVKIENDFLQTIADAGAIIMCLKKNDFWVMTGWGHALFQIRENAMHLECISVLSEERRQGKGTGFMKFLTAVAKETNTTITLEVSNVLVPKSLMIAPPVPIGVGSVTKDKIPVNQLPNWYAKFGFLKTEKYTEKKKEMIFIP